MQAYLQIRAAPMQVLPVGLDVVMQLLKGILCAVLG